MKRLDPNTGLPFKMGTVREDGKLFRRYIPKQTDSSGFFKEYWMSLNSYQKERTNYKISRDKIRSTKQGFCEKAIELIKSRSKKKQIPFNLTTQHLLDISVENCPVFNTTLHWGVGNKNAQTQPSLDRIVPKKGYVIGNVQWISGLANSMKFTATPEQLHQFADWIKASV